MSTANHFEPSLRGTKAQLYEFHPFLLDTIQHVLLKAGRPVALSPKTYDMLLLLVQNSGRMLSKEELMKSLWPDSFVEESNLTQQVSMIRRALGDSPGDPHFIVTVPGRGYRFSAEVRSWEEEKEHLGVIVSAPPLVSEAASRNGQKVVQPAGADLTGMENAERIPVPLKLRDGKTIRRTVLSIAAFALLCVLILAITKSLRPTKPETSQVVTAHRNLAILPLQNLKQDPDNDFLGFSLADAVITKLDYVSSLTVRPSTAVEKYRNQVIDIQKVAADLSVDTLLTGSFIRDGDDLRITYQLIDAKAEKIVGRGTIDLKYDKLLRVQDSVAQQIIQALQLNLSPSEANSIKPDAPINPLAYEYYLRGVDLHSKHNFPLAIKMLEKSTEIDPNYAPAWAYLGASYTSDAAFEFGGREQYRRARSAYEHALAIQPSQLDAHIFLANLLVDTGKVEQAVPLMRDALKTYPNQAAVHWELGYAYRFAGMLNESVAEGERALQLDPLVKANGSVFNTYLYLAEYDKFLRSLPDLDDPLVVFYRGFGEFHQKNWQQAAKDFDHAYELDPSLYAQIGKALSDSIAHRDADGLQILRALENKIGERGVGDPEGMYKISQAYSVLGDKTSALRALRRSIEGGFFCYPYFTTDPLFDGLRNDPEFAALLNVARQRHEAFRSKFF
ncbi:MAG TPA: winged helix-turn-helix domain-containing protein [Terriglobales bacterium]|jgi:DNA-binding winged helix-turn-helix (wHTH) protein/TolB-like protein|nr:winged helix-turn-helix domain-containing protein [Terriglobales bacterium]